MANRGLVRRDPFWQELMDFRSNFDDILSRFFQTPQGSSESGAGYYNWAPAAECYMKDNRFHVRLALPGVDPKDVNIQVHGNNLTISGERKQEQKVSEENYAFREFSYGSFQRTLTLPEGVKNEQVEAQYKNGVLEITAPVTEAALPRRVQIKSGGETKSIAA